MTAAEIWTAVVAGLLTREPVLTKYGWPGKGTEIEPSDQETLCAIGKVADLVVKMAEERGYLQLKDPYR